MESCSPSASSGEVVSSSDASFASDNVKTPNPWLAFNSATTLGLPQVPQLPRITAAVPLVPARCTVADLQNLHVSAQLVSTQLWLDPILNRQVGSPRSARDLLGLGGLHSSKSTSEADTVVGEVPDPSAVLSEFQPLPLEPGGPAPPSRAPVVNRWLSKHPILGSVLTPTVSAKDPSRQTIDPKAEPVLTDAACSPCHSTSKSPARRTQELELGMGTAGGSESRELLSLLKQFAEDAKMRAAAEEERARRERLERQQTSEAVEAAAIAAREAAVRCAAVQEEARRQAATAEADKLRQNAAAEAQAKAHRREVLLGAVAKWSDSNAIVFARCCLQAWLAEVVASRSEARMSDACAQTEGEKEQAPLQRCLEENDDGFVDPPPVISGGFLRALQSEEVWLDMQTGAISGAALWLSQTPPKASKSFVRTFDICLPWSEADKLAGSEEASSTTTVDPICLGEEQLNVPGSFLRSELISFPMSPLHSRLPSPTSRAGTPKSLAGSRGRSPMGSMGRKSPMPLSSPLAVSSEARMGLDDDEITPEKVLRRISGLMSEMTAMEVSLGTLRQELDVNTEEAEGTAPVEKVAEASAMEVIWESQIASGARRVPLRLRQPMPERMSWLESASRPVRATPSPDTVSHSHLVRPQSTGPRVSLDGRHVSIRNAGSRGRPPSKVGQSRPGARRRSASATRRPPRAVQGRQRHSMPPDEWNRSALV